MKSQAFKTILMTVGNGAVPPPVEEHQFHDTRKWRFDYCWPHRMLAVEIEGGVYSGGGHVRGKHYQSDCEKYNAAVLLGWRVLRYTTTCLRERPVQIVEEVQAALAEVNHATDR